MDSGNSGSIQSSSGGGDEEYDSRPDSISSFLSTPGGLSFTSHHHHHHPPPSASSFDALSTYLDAFSRPPPLVVTSNPILNCTGIGSLVVPAAAPPNTSFSIPISPSQGPFAGNISMGPLPSASSSSQQPSAAPHVQPPGAAAPTAPSRGSKKRLRASRRAPTTVLTTDTSNFRAMVQEFTGVPSPPLSSLAYPRPRYDLLRAVTSVAGRYPGMPDAAPDYLLRPFPQKVSVPFASGSSSASSASAIIGFSTTASNITNAATATASGAASRTSATTSITSAIATAATATATATASITPVSTSTTSSNRHHLPSDLRLGSQHRNFLGAFSFQSFLPPSPAAKHNSPTAPDHGMENAPQVSAAAAAAAAGYGIDGGGGRGPASAHLGTVPPSLAASAGASSSRPGWGDTGRDDLPLWFEGSAGTDGGDRGQFRSVLGGSYGDRQRGNICKLNCTGSASSDYHQEKGSENVPTRGEGMVDSWICSSD